MISAKVFGNGRFLPEDFVRLDWFLPNVILKPSQVVSAFLVIGLVLIKLDCKKTCVRV